MNNVDKQYIELCRDILSTGSLKGDRTGTGAISKFGAQMRFDLSEGFPLLTTKKVHFKSIVGELLWFLRGDTNIKFLQDNGIKIWDAWADKNGEIGDMYGSQWRNWSDGFEGEYGTDQIAILITQLALNPDSRRHVVSAWNVDMLPETHLPSNEQHTWDGTMALAPCHYSFQCYVQDGKLSMLVNQRSADMLLGVPFNIASYALLTHMLAQVCGLQVGELIWSGADCHIYTNHIEQVTEQIRRFDNGEVYQLPTLKLDSSITDIDDFSFKHIELVGYKSGAAIKGEVAV